MSDLNTAGPEREKTDKERIEELYESVRVLRSANDSLVETISAIQTNFLVHMHDERNGSVVKNIRPERISGYRYLKHSNFGTGVVTGPPPTG